MPPTVKGVRASALAAVPRMSPARMSLEGLLNRRKQDGVLIADVHDTPELALDGKVRGDRACARGILEFRGEPGSFYRDLAFEKDGTAVMYRASGGRAALTGKTVRESGYASL